MQTNIESREFYSSAFLMASGVDLIDTYKQGPLTVFVFENTQNAKDLLKKYFAMKAIVNAAKYAAAIKNLKSVIHGTNTNTQPNNTHERFKKCQTITI